MSGELRIEYPDSPPDWLQQWPAEAEIRGVFPEGIRRYGYRILSQERSLRLTWRQDRLTAYIGSQVTAWRWIAPAWTRTCSCGYVTDRCAHAFVAACLFAEVCRREGWQPGGAAADAGPAPAPAARAPVPETASVPGPVALPPRLEVEVDFRDRPGMVGIRFYLNTEDRRTLLRLQRVHNEVRRAAAPSEAGADWLPADREFLSWLRPELEGRPEIRQNLNVLRLRQSRFEHWLDRWEAAPGRFLERVTQQFLTREGTARSRMVVELEDQGEWIQIGALLVLPNGTRRYLHEIFEQLATGEGARVVDGQILDFTPPLSWNLLREVFSRRCPRMRREHICGHLADLLEGRIDIVEGACVRQREEAGPPVHIAASAEGADVILTAQVGAHALDLEAAAVTGDVTEEEGTFVITVFRGPAITAARRFLQGLRPESAGAGRYRIPGTPERMAALRKAWLRRPEGVETAIGKRLESLLGEPCAATPCIGVRDRESFVDLRLAWTVGGHRISDAELRDAAGAGTPVLRTRQGDWLAIDPESVRTQLAAVEEEGFGEDGALQLFRPEARETAQRLVDRFQAETPTRDRGVLQALLREAPPRPLSLPGSLAGVARPYQRRGFEFIAERLAYGIGPILADDMGLGKTLQVLGLLEAMQEERAPERFRALVICPASVVSVWLEQAAQFCPRLAITAFGGERETRHALLAGDQWSTLVANYAIVRTDAEHFTGIDFDVVVLDEAQQIKNPDSQISRVVKGLKTERALALTGTPLENRLLDLWSIMEFLNPGFLGNKESFVAGYEAASRSRELARRVAPLMLRRTKEAVAPELPPRTEEVLHIDLGEEQQALYNAQLIRARNSLGERGTMGVLAALTRLRQICCHPQLLRKERTEIASAKLDTLLDMLAELVAEGHSALVFSQFTSLLEILGERLDASELPWLRITGNTPTPRRAALVQEFNESSESQVFLLSLRAAGTGLTLTKADYVFIYDPWWNPAVERQAIDRTHRIGQEKPVFAYRLISTNTVEEKVLALQKEKAQLFSDVMEDTADRTVAGRLTRDDIQRLLAD